MRPIAQASLALALLVECTRSATTEPSTTPGAAPTLQIRTRVTNTTPIYIEGTIPLVHIVGQGIDEVARLGDGLSRILAGPGRYALESWVRPCDGNCGSLDAPTDHCYQAFHIDAGQTFRVEITLQSGQPCTITQIGGNN